MSECEKYENADITIEKYIEELKQEKEILRQELHVAQLKLAAYNTLEKEFQESNKALEESLAECKIQTEKILAKKEREYKEEKEDSDNYIAKLEADAENYNEEMGMLLKKLRKYEDLYQQHHDSTCTDDNSEMYKKEIEILTTLLESESERAIQLETKLDNVESQYEELNDILRITKNQLEDKNVILESIREELAMNRIELASLKVAPASDTCKGNSLFAEVEDERKKLLDNLKSLQSKYQEAKQEINSKLIEIKTLKTEYSAMLKKWENREIDILQEKTDLLEMYKSRVFTLEAKLKAEIKKNDQKELEHPNNSFNYAQLLLDRKVNEIKHLNEKLEMQTTQILVQEEVRYNTAKQLQYWESKAKSLEAQVSVMKTQLEKAAVNDNIDTPMSETVDDCENANTDSKKKHLKVTFDDYVLSDTKETKDKQNKPLKKQSQDYRKIFISEDL